jgi:hypothetical protein
MKSLILSLVLITTASVASARSPQRPASPTVLRISTMVFFAPSEMRGTYSTIVTKDGQVTYVDNKNKKTEIAKLAPNAVLNLLKKIQEVQPGELVPESDGPGCMDAPSTGYFVVKADGSEIQVAEHANCQNSVIQSGYEVRSLASSIQHLSQSLR